MSVTSPAGFRAAGVTAGLKDSGSPDLAAVVNDGPGSAAAAVFTSNRCKANPVMWSQHMISGGTARAVVLNSGGANCYTGAAGYSLVEATAARAAQELNTTVEQIQICSTGLIGSLFSRDAVLAGTSAAMAALTRDGGDAAAGAILTTDSHAKQAEVEGDGYRLGAMAKGAGMLAPALATMLVVITTDADLGAAELDSALRAATAQTFDRLDSDGCQSTNDTVLLMSSGASAVAPPLADFTARLTDVCRDLALQLLADAEGAEHDIAITVVGAASQDDALDVARSVARSNLFKCAIFGRDPNWGRILASVGTTAAVFDPANLDVALNGVWVCRNSGPGDPPENVDLTARDVTVEIDLKSGSRQATVWTNDLTHAYVHENSAYST